ncbi:MAG: hypothetical protein ACKV2T_30225 [Kofleriaceae bacterium]
MRIDAGVLVLLVAGGCRCGGDKAVPPPPPRPTADAALASVLAPTLAPISEADSIRAIGCVLEASNGPRMVFAALAEDLAPPALIRRAIDSELSRAKEDGESPVAIVLADAVEVYMEIGDRDALVATFAAIDKLSDTNSLLFGHHGPQRTRAGLVVDKKDFAGDELAITRERALAGDKAGAARFYDDVAGTSDSAHRLEERVGALVAIDRIAEATAVIQKAKAEDRLGLAGAWLDVALRRSGALDEAMQVVLAELARAPDRAIAWWNERAAFRRAARLGRARELRPLYDALVARHAKSPPENRAIPYDLAALVGDAETTRALEKEPALAHYVAVRTGPIEAALANAKAQKYPGTDYARVWQRASTQPVPPGFGATLVATVCPPDAGPRKPAAPPLAGAKLVAKEKSRGMREECELHDVIVTLADASGKKLGTETLEGECTGACTAAAKREGQESLDEIQKRIDEGEASQSETDYNFTDCMFRGPDGAKTQTVAGRKLVLIPIHGIGPHDVPKTSYQIAIEVCGALHVLESFGTMYAHSWRPAELALRESADQSQIVVDGKSSFWNGVVARVLLPSECPGAPRLEALPTE